MLLVLPSIRRRGEKNEKKQPIGDWMRHTFLKPEDPSARSKEVANEQLSVEELELKTKLADDKERGIGLIAGPVGAAIGFVVVHSLVVNDPPRLLRNGVLDKLYVNPTLYDEVLLVLIALSVLIVVMALLRKRLLLGIATALYGVTIFNLHYWGFGIPFAICGAWYIVRAYRLNRDLKYATGDSDSRFAARSGRNSASYTASGPGANKRYTPPRASSAALKARRSS
jgi:hypothetical protein